MWEAAAGEVLECVREPHNVLRICRGCEQTGNNHGTFTTKVVKRVLVALATREHDILYSDWGEKILRRSVHCVNLLSCTVHKSARVIFVP